MHGWDFQALSQKKTGIGCIYLCSYCGSVAVEFCIGLDVVGVYHQGFTVQLVGSVIVVLLESEVAFLFLCL